LKLAIAPWAKRADAAAAQDTRCARCANFRDDPQTILDALPGLQALSSVHGAVRARDGICLRHQRLVARVATCPEFQATTVP
jgi:hypothetical protein